MKVGSLGGIPFTVSDSQIQTISNGASWAGSAEITAHKVHNGNAVTEFTGLGADTIDLKIKLSAFLGVNPMSLIDQVWAYERSGTALPLILGDKAYGKYRWLIRSHQITMQRHDNRGNLIEATVSLKLVEYQKKGRSL